MKKFISFSGGVESSTMAILYGNEADLIWCDTGAEHDEIYKRVDDFEIFIKSIHTNCNLIRLTANVKHKGQYYNSLIDYALATKFLPNNGARYCTAEFKIKPIDNFLKSQGNCELMIGFNYDEKDRAGNMEKIRNVTYSYPLITDEFDRSDCENILKNYGVHPTFPAYMSRGGCKMCYFKSENEYKAMYYLNRKEFNEIKELEQKIQDKKTNFFAIMPSGKSMQQLENELQNTLDLDFISMYKSKEKTCGAFCRR